MGLGPIPDGSPSPDGGSLPTWIFDLRALVPLVGTIVTAMTNPVQWLKGPVLTIIVEAAILRPMAWVYGYILMAAGIVEDAILTLPPILSSPLLIVGDALNGAVTGIYDGVYGILLSLGMGAPIAAAGAVAVGLILLLTIALALWKLIPGTDILDGVTQWTS